MMTAPPLQPTPQSVTQRIAELGVDQDDATATSVKEFVDTLSPESLSLLSSQLNGDEAKHAHDLIMELVYDDRSPARVRETKLREYFVLIDDNERDDVSMNLALVEGLHCIKLLEQRKDMTSGDSEHIQRCKSLIKIGRSVVRLKEERGLTIHDQIGVVFLTDPHVVHLAMDQADRADQIAAFINERQELNLESIQTMLETIPPLSPGTL